MMNCQKTKVVNYHSEKECKENASTFEEIVCCYLKFNNGYIEPWKNFVINSNNIDEAIRRAVNSKTANNYHHGHQKRIKKGAYKTFINYLKNNKKKILNCKDFKCLIDICDYVFKKPNGIGLLFSYDVALRLAEYLKAKEGRKNILPKEVYLHAGPLKSAKVILGSKNINRYSSNNGRSIDKNCLPKEFCKLKPYQIEEVLCIYHEAIEKAIKHDWVDCNDKKYPALNDANI